jgi:hypothetical protein
MVTGIVAAKIRGVQESSSIHYDREYRRTVAGLAGEIRFTAEGKSEKDAAAAGRRFDKRTVRAFGAVLREG